MRHRSATAVAGTAIALAAVLATSAWWFYEAPHSADADSTARHSHHFTIGVDIGLPPGQVAPEPDRTRSHLYNQSRAGSQGDGAADDLAATTADIDSGPGQTSQQRHPADNPTTRRLLAEAIRRQRLERAAATNPAARAQLEAEDLLARPEARPPRPMVARNSGYVRVLPVAGMQHPVAALPAIGGVVYESAIARPPAPIEPTTEIDPPTGDS